VASRFLTTKIPSALLVAVVWLQHTRCPRFRRGTFGYGIVVWTSLGPLPRWVPGPLLGGPLGLPGLRYTASDGVEHKDYRGVVLG
jgi:hypothetical protein